MHSKNNFHFECTELCFVIHYLLCLCAHYSEIFLANWMYSQDSREYHISVVPN